MVKLAQLCEGNLISLETLRCRTTVPEATTPSYRSTGANGRRADVVALSGGGDVLIVEIKSCLLDYQSDGKWQDYLPFCDRLYFAVAADFPCDVIPTSAGLILADRYGAELVREPVEERLTAARRKAMMLSFARAAALRLQLHLDPSCGFEI